MLRKPKAVTKVVRLLTDPYPEFVSLVGHGANQTPLKVVKGATIADFRDQDEGNHEMSIDLSRKVARSRTRTQKATTDQSASPVVDVKKMAFAKTQFATTEAVTKYLADHGYEGFEIAEKETAFEVVEKGAEVPESLREIADEQTGVTMFVVKEAAATEDTQEDDQAAKAADPEPKAGVEGEQVVKAEGVTAEHVQSTKSVWDLEYFGETLQCLIWFGSDRAWAEENGYVDAAVAEVIKTHAAALVEVFKTLAVETADQMAMALKSEATQKAIKEIIETQKVEKTEAPEPAAPEGEAKPDAGTAEVSKTEGAADADAGVKPDAQPVAAPDTTDVAKAISEAVAPLASVMGELATAMKAMSEGTTKALGELREQVTKGEERVSALEEVRQTRKSADTADAGAGTQEAPKVVKKGLDDPLTRNLLGMRRGG